MADDQKKPYREESIGAKLVIGLELLLGLAQLYMVSTYTAQALWSAMNQK